MLQVTYKDGSTVDVDPGGPWSPREQIDWEQQFRSSFLTVYKAAQAEAAAARADDSGEGEHAAMYFRVQWVLWFAWHRLRASGQAAAKFDVWFDTVDDYDFLPDPEPPAPEPAAELPAPAPTDPLAIPPESPVEASSLDPTSVPAP